MSNGQATDHDEQPLQQLPPQATPNQQQQEQPLLDGETAVQLSQEGTSATPSTHAPPSGAQDPPTRKTTGMCAVSCRLSDCRDPVRLFQAPQPMLVAGGKAPRDPRPSPALVPDEPEAGGAGAKETTPFDPRPGPAEDPKDDGMCKGTQNAAGAYRIRARNI